MDSAGLYVHIPFCLAKCAYCDFFSLPCAAAEGGAFVPDSYIKALLCEARFYRRKYGIDSWRTVYIGGGTPSLMTSGQIATLARGLLEGTKTAPLEFTIEMNPETLSLDKLSAARDCGVTRLSLGIQSLCQKALDAVGRHCTAVCAQKVLDMLRPAWGGDLSLDAIAGLPFQNRDEFELSLRKILEYSPEHFSLYSLMIEDGTPLERSISSGKIPFDDDEADGQWLLGRDILEEKGYGQYEVSNFALKGHESIHNGSYWSQLDYVGVGSGATGTVYAFDGRGAGRGLRWTGSRDISRYCSFWNESVDGALESSFGGLDFSSGNSIPADFEVLDLETLEFEYLMMALRTLKGVNSLEYERRFASVEPWRGDIKKRLGSNTLWKDFEGKNMCFSRDCPSGGRDFALNKKGLLFLNSLLRNF